MNVTIEKVVGGNWKCNAYTAPDPDDPSEPTVCYNWELTCNDGTRVDCVLLCIDDRDGWTYQVIYKIYHTVNRLRNYIHLVIISFDYRLTDGQHWDLQ